MAGKDKKKIRGSVRFSGGQFFGWVTDDSNMPVSIIAVSFVQERIIWTGACEDPRNNTNFKNKNCGFSFPVPGDCIKSGGSVRFFEKETGRELGFSPYVFSAEEEQWVAKLVDMSNLPLMRVSALVDKNGRKNCRLMLVNNDAEFNPGSLIVENAQGEQPVDMSLVRIVPPPGKNKNSSIFWFTRSWPQNFLNVDLTRYFESPKKDKDIDYVTLKWGEKGKVRPVTDVRDVGMVPAERVKYPPETNVRRVQAKGSVDQKFTTVGFTNYRSYRAAFEAFSGKEWSSIDKVLDWGCGCGRVTQHLIHSLSVDRVFGVDIDKANIDWCKTNLNKQNFISCDTVPPLAYPDGTFDYIVGTSVFTHIPEELIDPWLAELKRVLKPGGMASLTVATETRMAFGSCESDRLQEIEKTGIEDSIKNSQLDNSIDDKEYYRNVRMTKSYVTDAWSRHFEDVSILDHAIGVQDIVVGKKGE